MPPSKANPNENENENENVIEVRCQACNEKVRVTRAKAERDFKAKCPNGHEVPLVKAL